MADDRTPAGRRNAAPTSAEIVRVAVELADRAGIDEVSMRTLATAAGTGTTSLYRRFPSRAELVAAMIDAAWTAFEPPPTTGDWRVDLTAFAVASRRVFHRHRWLPDLVAGRPPLGDNALRRYEYAFRAVAPVDSDPHRRAVIVDVTTAYLVGAVGREFAEARARSAAGPEDAWRHAAMATLRPRLAAGEFPYLREFIESGPDGGDGPAEADERFLAGLAVLLDGIAAGR